MERGLLPPPQTPEQFQAEAVKLAVANLNAQIGRAMEEGLRIVLDAHEVSSLGAPPRPVVDVTVLKPL